jgi:uncharacterized protein
MKWQAIPALMILASCGSSPPPRTYVLSTPVEPVARVVSEVGRPVLELPRVSLPDYLDTTDIVLRDGRNELKVSQTGRWGERLSVGITDALSADLRQRLPGFLVARTSPSGMPARRLLVNVEAFDIGPDGRCVLTARWTIVRDDRRGDAAAQRDTIVTEAARTGDGISDVAVAAAMAVAIEQLADRIAAAMRSVPGGR